MAEEWDVFALQPGGDYAQPEYLATLYEAFDKQIIVELGNSGSGSFSINRSAPECTEEVLAQGNLVKVRTPEISPEYTFAFFLETGDFTLVSSQEVGGETLTFGGRGILSYLEYARAAHASFVTGGDDPEAGVWRAYNAGTGSAPGQILRRLLEEFQHADRVLPNGTPTQPLPLLTIDFDYTNDSAGDPWDTTDATDEFSYQVGEDGLAIVLRLLETETIRVQMSPDFLLSAYNVDQYGRDLTGDAFGAGVVRFERGVNIATELRRELSTATPIPETHMFVQGEADQYGGAVLSDAASRVTREAFLAAFGTGATALNGIGAVDLALRLKQSIHIQFPINNRRTQDVVLVDPVSVGAVASTPGLAVDGYYLPGPEGTLGDFWVGDTVRVHTGAGPFDYNEVDALVNSITIARENDNAELAIFVELVSPVQVPGVPQFFTHTTLGSCDTGAWPEGSPGDGHLLVGFGVQRDGGVGNVTPYGAITDANVPIGTTAVPGACDPADNIAGTEWELITSLSTSNGAGQTSAALMAWRDSVVGEPARIVWQNFPPTSRPRTHQIAIEGLSGAPTVVEASAAGGFGPDPGSVHTSPNITVPAAGYIFVGYDYHCTGPADGSSSPFVLTARTPAVDLTQGFAHGSFGPYSWFGYLQVASAGTYNIVLDRSTAPRKSLGYGWIMGFWPS